MTRRFPITEHAPPSAARGPAAPPPALTAIAALVLSAASAGASPLSAAVGCDYHADSDGQRTRAVVATGAASLGAGEAFVSGAGYDNDRIGRGVGLTLGGVLPLRGPVRLHGLATRFAGEADYRAWRFQAGPLLGSAGGATLGLYYLRDASSLGSGTDGASAEAGVPLRAGLTLRARAGYAFAADRSRSAQAALGASWEPLRRLELSTEVGLAGAAAAAAGPTFPAARRPGDGLPLVGRPRRDGDGAPAGASTTTSWTLGARIGFP